jgi:Ser/Thr protein kinase RdoA (MazF antagonist)
MLRAQVIHSDANPENVLVAGKRLGFIDFGDAIKAPLVFDVAIAASYMRVFDGDPTMSVPA